MRFEWASLALINRLRRELPTVIFLFMLDWDINETDVRRVGLIVVPSTSEDDEREFSGTLNNDLQRIRRDF